MMLIDSTEQQMTPVGRRSQSERVAERQCSSPVVLTMLGYLVEHQGSHVLHDHASIEVNYCGGLLG